MLSSTIKILMTEEMAVLISEYLLPEQAATTLKSLGFIVVVQNDQVAVPARRAGARGLQVFKRLVAPKALQFHVYILVGMPAS